MLIPLPVLLHILLIFSPLLHLRELAVFFLWSVSNIDLTAIIGTRLNHRPLSLPVAISDHPTNHASDYRSGFYGQLSTSPPPFLSTVCVSPAADYIYSAECYIIQPLRCLLKCCHQRCMLVYTHISISTPKLVKCLDLLSSQCNTFLIKSFMTYIYFLLAYNVKVWNTPGF